MDIDSAPTSNASEVAFVSWLTGHGGVISPSVGLTQFEGMGRGAVALVDIPADTLLFSLPRPLLLTTSTSLLPTLLPVDQWAELGGWTPLILILMYEYNLSQSATGTTSLWKPYFDLLPPLSSFNSLMFWSEEELKDLKGSLVLSKIGKEEAEEQYHDVLLPLVLSHPTILVGGVEKYSLELFHWMGTCILSRSFHVESGEGKEESDSDDEEEEEKEDVGDVAMVPMADLLNARSGSENARLFYEPLSLNMLSTQAIPAGTQIFNTYADPPNSDLLRRYGHVDENNESDLVEISLELVVDLLGESVGLDEEKREERAEWLLDLGVEDSFSFDADSSLPDELVSAIKTFLMTSVEFTKAQEKERLPRPIFDQKVKDLCREIFAARMAEYETSIEIDQQLLLNPSLPPRKRMAIQVRLSEKLILTMISKETAEMEVEVMEVKRKREDGNGDGGRKKSRA